MQHAAAQLLGDESISSSWSALRTTQSGNPLANSHAGDLLHRVRNAFEVLDVDRADYPDPRIEDLEHVLPTLGMRPGARHVRVGELVDESDFGLAGKDRLEVHLLKGRTPVLDDLARDDREVA